MQNVIRLPYSQSGILKQTDSEDYTRSGLLAGSVSTKDKLSSVLSDMALSRDALEENKPSLRSVKIYITPGSYREIRHSNITFLSPWKIKFIAYHIFALSGSSNSHPKHCERTRTSICGVIQGFCYKHCQ